MTDVNVEDLKAQVTALKQGEPKLRAREIADRLKISEAQLLALRVGEGVTRLDDRFKEMLEGMPAVGRVMVLTRNESVVHERKGEFDNVKLGKVMGIVLNREIDLRIFLGKWVHGFLVRDALKTGERVSVQVFDETGKAIHKIYLQDESNRAAFDALIESHIAAEQSQVVQVRHAEGDPVERPDSDVDAVGFLKKWSEMTDVHQYMGMLKNFDITRPQSMRLAEGKFAERLPASVLDTLLNRAAQLQLPIMAFVSNRGCVQIHTGPIERVERIGPWLNVLDPDFNLHVFEERLDRAYIVRRPTVDGDIHALEFFDKDDHQVLAFYGERTEGHPELTDWRNLLSELLLPQAAE